jgi:SagB-type dehydrogenase family enzyme
MTSKYKSARQFLKADLWEAWDSLSLDQEKGLPHPPVQKPYPPDAQRIGLVPPAEITLATASVFEAIHKRESHRNYTSDPISMETLSYLLWATQGVHRVIRGGETTIRTVPSAGARHPFETYLFVNYVSGLPAGLYRYLAIEHQLLVLQLDESLVYDVNAATHEQYVMDSAVVFIWTALPYRAEWRYGPLAHKMIAQDSGHICQNLYLACASVGLGTCAIGAYHQEKMDRVLGADGLDEFTIYVATVGCINP